MRPAGTGAAIELALYRFAVQPSVLVSLILERRGNPPVFRDAYPEGTAEIPLKPAADHDWNGIAWVHDPQPEPVPPEVTSLQLHHEMDQTHGVDLEDAVAALSPKAAKRYRLANTIRRTDPMVDALQQNMGWTDAQVDALFRAAAAR